MIEILWHGRGGQGAFTAARLLGAAWSQADGHHALAFPSFGPERRGAPMRAFTKLGRQAVCDHSASAQADFVIYLDHSLFLPGWEKELKPGGRVLLNAQEKYDDPRVVSIDADGISRQILGRAIPNTTFLGALAALLDELDPEHVHAAIREYMAPKLHAGNIAVVDEAIRAIAARKDVAEGPDALAKDAAGDDRAAAGHAAEAKAASAATPPVSPLPAESAPFPQRIVPSLKTGALDPQVYARSTCFEAGHLVSKNAGWRQVRPVIDEASCTGCLQCWLQCPDGTLVKLPTQANRAGVAVAVDYDFCKGCGICAKACKFGAIAMVPEQGGEKR